MVAEQRKFDLTRHEIYQMHEAANVQGGYASLPRAKFFSLIHVTYEEERARHVEFILKDLQEQVSKEDPSIVFGYLEPKKRVAWYIVPEGSKPYTEVPFYERRDEADWHPPTDFELQRAAREREEILKEAEAIRIARGDPIPKHKRIDRPLTELERLRPYIREARRRRRVAEIERKSAVKKAEREARKKAEQSAQSVPPSAPANSQ